jgi:adenylate cyclase
MAEAVEPDAGQREALQAALRAEIKRNERQRVLALAGVLSVLLLVITGLVIVYPRLVAELFRERLAVWTPFAIFLPYIGYELLVATVLRRLSARDNDIPRVLRYANAFIETSLPGILLLVQVNAMGAEEALGFWTPLLYFVFIILSTLRLDFWLSTFTGAVAAVELFVIAFIYLDLASPAAVSYQLSRSVVLLASGALAGVVGLRLRRQFEKTLDAVTARDRVTNLFGQHVSPQIVERLLSSGAGTLSESRRVCVMFVDIRGFTAAAHARTPSEVVARLNAAFDVLVGAVDRHGGIINKFLGDGFLAMFGAPIADPHAARNAVAAAREMVLATETANRGSDWPIRIGIGIHIGEAVTGNVGSPRRKEFTVIGDTVNLAARLEALNKEFGSQILVSAEAHRDAGQVAEAGQFLGPVEVRGMPQPIPVWRLA